MTLLRSQPATLRGALAATADSAVLPDGVAVWVRNVSNTPASELS